MKKIITTLLLIAVCVCSGIAQNYVVSHKGEIWGDWWRAGRRVQIEFYYPSATTATEWQAIAEGQFPLVVLGHGFSITWTEYDYLYQAIAAKGYIVAVPRTEGSLSPSHAEFGKDMSFIVKRMKKDSQKPGTFFYNHYNQKSAVIGHSMGGGAAFLAMQDNPLINTMITYAAAETDPSAIAAAAGITRPALVMAGSLDCVAPAASHQTPMYNALGSSYKSFVNLTNGSHCQFGKASAFSRCNLAEGAACGGSAGNFMSLATQHQKQIDATLAWLNYFLKNNCAGWTAWQAFLLQTGHTYLQSGTAGVGCVVANPESRETQFGADAENRLVAYPNPVNSDLQVDYMAVANTNVRVELINSLGQVIASQHIIATKGNNQTSFTMADFASGLYLVRVVESGKPLLVQKIVKE